MKQLKDEDLAAYDMLNTSGFGWNDAQQCMTVDAQVYKRRSIIKEEKENN